MKERINWIDWAKALAAIAVIIIHLPQSQEWFYYRYIQTCSVVVFIFISGYLKKDRGSEKHNCQKYWYGLVAPYILYNAIVYPYWLGKYFLLNGRWPDLFTALKPIFGAMLFQHENAFCEPLNGPLWYLPAILFMHFSIDLCRKTRYQHSIMITLCIVSIILYAANKYWYFAPNLTPMGIMRYLPYYYIGYLFGQRQLFRNTNKKFDPIGCVLFLTASLLLFAWHLNAYFAGQHLLQIFLYYPVNLCFLFGIIYGCKLLNSHTPTLIVNLSIGTLVIIGLHFPIISLINYLLERHLGIDGIICYQWYEAVTIAIVITTLLYPIILLGKKLFPILIGKK